MVSPFTSFLIMFNTTIKLGSLKFTIPCDFGNSDVALAVASEEEISMELQEVIFEINGNCFLLIVDSACHIWNYWRKIKELAGLNSNELLFNWDFEVFDCDYPHLTGKEMFKDIEYHDEYLMIFASRK